MWFPFTCSKFQLHVLTYLKTAYWIVQVMHCKPAQSYIGIRATQLNMVNPVFVLFIRVESTFSNSAGCLRNQLNSDTIYPATASDSSCKRISTTRLPSTSEATSNLRLLLVLLANQLQTGPCSNDIPPTRDANSHTQVVPTTSDWTAESEVPITPSFLGLD